MLPLPRLVLPHVEFAEGTVLHDVAIGAHGLLEDFLAVCHEEQLQVFARCFSESPVVEGCNDGFAGAGGGDQQVVVETLEALGFQVLEHLFLVQERLELEAGGRSRDCRTPAAVAFQRRVQLFAVALRIVALEGSLLPVAVERDFELLQQGGRADGAEPDVPFQAVQKRGLAEVGAADVGGVEAGVAAEQSSLGMQASGLGFVVDLHLGAVAVDELVDGAAFRGAHVGGGDDPELGAVFLELLQCWFEEPQTRVARRLEAFVRAATSATSSPALRPYRLLAVPFFGTAGGGAGNHLGATLRGLLDVCSNLASEFAVDLVIVLRDKAAFSLAQKLRREAGGSECWPTLGDELHAKARKLGELARSCHLVPSLGAGVSVSAGAPSWRDLLTALRAGVQMEEVAAAAFEKWQYSIRPACWSSSTSTSTVREQPLAKP